MIYKDFKGLKLPALGFGCMRLPKDEQTGKIDREKTEEMIAYAFKNGINYFDTSFFYHAGESEKVVGEILANYPRDTWFLADKLPGNCIEIVDGKIVMDIEWAGMGNKTFEDTAELFQYQLDRCGVDYFDFYLLHNLTESTFDLYADEEVGIVKYLVEQKKAGRIKHLGFSAHGRYQTIDKFLSTFDCFEFVLLQLNYLDWSLQEAGKKYDVITKHGIPVFVMEPVRGGLLVAPGEEAEAVLKAANPNETPASWAFRFLQALPNVCVVVSGMTTMGQLVENTETFSKIDPLNESEKAVLQQIVDNMASFVPCTTCLYCVDACPQKLDIPTFIALYNEASNKYSWMVDDVIDTLDDDKKPQACTGCGACNPLCPQNIDIPDTIAKLCKLVADNAS